MAKELPYFKFEPNQWENGNIQMLSREDKGLFMDLCSMYWSRLGDVPLKLAVQKLCGGNATAFDSLISEQIFEVIDERVCINYLNEQLSEFEDTSKQNSKNAKARWEKHRKQKDSSDRNATASNPQCESDAIREEKRREEKIIDTERYQLFISKWNTIKGTKYKGSKNDINNFKFWLDTYSPAEIIKAIENHDDTFWAESINPQWLFRTKDTKGQPVDYIGQLLNHKPKNKMI